MVMDWGDWFRFGVYSGFTVKNVFDRRPSYLVWLRVNTRVRFQPDITQRLCEYVDTAPLSRGGLSANLRRAFRELRLEEVASPW